jgi:uncharacterized membrane protein YkoI
MRRALPLFMIMLLLPAIGVFAEEGEEAVALKGLPPAVQKSVQDLVKGAELKGFSKEIEKGATVYEVETLKDGNTRDVLIDAAGVILEIEEGTALERIPGPAKAAIEKAAQGGKIARVESVTRKGVTSYEAIIVKEGKRSEIKATASGEIMK